MKVETPQILWHNGSENDNGKNAPLYSLTMLEASRSSSRRTSSSTTAPSSATEDSNNKCHVLATAGNTSEVNLWRVAFSKSDSPKILQNHSVHKIEHLVSLSRHDRSVNVVAFSPDGLHLATAGDSGAIIVWSVPPSKRSTMGGSNNQYYWSTLEKENDLNCRIVSSPCAEGICDLSWSADSKRFVLGSIDHCVMIYETDANQDNWKCVYRNTRDHTHYVQGVAYDPLGVYVSSMGSDRTVRVYSRKPLKKKKQQSQAPVVLQAADPNATSDKNGNDNKSQQQLQEQQQQQQQQRAAMLLQRALTDSKLELGKGKTLKYRHHPPVPSTNSGENTTTAPPPPKKQYLFADESTVESFFRRLSWTKDGAFLVTPAALWHGSTSPDDAMQSSTNSNSASPTFATYLYARHRFDEPYKVLPGLEKPSVVIRPNPVLFKLPESVSSETKENKTSQSLPTPSQDNNDATTTQLGTLPYRSIFAVLTLDTVILYDTHHLRPLCIARGLHYAGLTDATWSADGLHLLVSSTDGYISILSFQPGELGEIYTPPVVELVEEKASPTATAAPSANVKQVTPPTALVPTVPPCEPGQTATLVAPPAKRAKKTRITPTLVSAAAPSSAPLAQNNANAVKESMDDTASTTTAASSGTKKRLAESSSCAENETEVVGAAVTKLTLEGNNNQSAEEQPKKKKRIQPMLVSIGQ